jgi:general secretion pathway protein D
MTRHLRPAIVFLLVALAALPALADKAKDLYDKGKDAEARQQYEAALDFFRQAYQLKPKELRYRAAFEHSRFDAGAEVVHRGQKLRAEGKLQEAVAEFQKAVTIDPSSFIAQQELTKTLKMINDQQNPTPQAAGTPGSLERKIHGPAAPSNSLPFPMFQSR